MISAGFLADFIGGPASGKRVRLRDDCDKISIPVPPPDPGIANYWLDEPDLTQPAFRFATYRRIGIRDDGRRVYAYQAAASTG